ncbi:hypothetical protein WOLCODRAFT_160469 [Wolfiporia cocos MD-104 SS10]|uniref:Chromo domain-containing protein n=1 Tax=Wolfiporia cocos (strain MD-104) TaxID=742152 RepID=A0A2H3JDA8_WOLCO|nr:hypothetical protein WOLCODRAFT_160469 [Wolfiporia cocos MD-104 SS10]
MSENEAQFVSQENDDDALWEVIEVLEERGNRYKVKWAGNDPATGNPWAPSWVNKADCTDELIYQWKAKQARNRNEAANRKKGRPRTSTKPSETSKRPSATVSVSPGKRATTKVHTASSSRSSASTTNVSKAGTSRTRQETATSPSRSRLRLTHASIDDDTKSDVQSLKPPPRKKRKVVAEVIPPVRDTKGKKKAAKEPADYDGDPPTPPHEVKVGPPRGVNRKGRAADEVKEGTSNQGDKALSSDLPPPVAFTRIGPPKEAKRTKRPEESTSALKSHSSDLPVKIGPPRGVKRKGRAVQSNLAIPNSPEEPRIPPTSGHSDFKNNADDRHDINPSSSQVERNEPGIDLTAVPVSDSLNVDGINPEALQSSGSNHTQGHATRDTSPIVDKPAISPHARSIQLPDQPPSSSSIVARMKHHTEDGKSVSKKSTRRGLPTIDEALLNASSHSPSNEPRRAPPPKKPSKPLRTLPYVSPSVFRPYLPEQEIDAPPSSIEQFSSPERGSARAAGLVMRKAELTVRGKGKGKGKATEVISRRDDEILRLRGQELAEEAASRRRASSRASTSEDNDWLFRESPSPPPDQRESRQSSGPLTPPAVDDYHMTEDYHMTINSDDIAREMEDAFLNLDAELRAGDEQDWATMSEPGVEPGQVFSLSPELLVSTQNGKNPSSKRTGGSGPSSDPHSVSDDVPTVSMRQADINSQILDHTLSQTEVNDLKFALEEKSARILELEHKLAALQAQASKAQVDHAEVSAAKEALASKHEEQARSVSEVTASNVRLAGELDALRLEHAREKDELEKTLQEASNNVAALERRVRDAEDDRDFVRDLYDKASSYASEMKAQKLETEEQLRVAKGQVSDGLPMLKSMYEERIKRLQGELEKSKRLYKILTDKDERTNDEIRRRAALEPQLREENKRLRQELQAANKLLTASGRSISPDSDDDAEPLKQTGTRDNRNPFVPELSPLVRSPDPDESRDVYVCQYVSNAIMCNTTFPTPGEVRTHALHSHYSHLREYL